MGTPEKSKNNRIATSVRRLEDSPIFDFLNNLSPIKPVKPMPFTQTFSQLTYASLQSVFTSPHAASPKERRPRLSDPLRPELSTSDWNTVNENMDSVDADTKPEDDHEEKLDPTPPDNHQLSNELYLQKRADIIAELMRSPEHIDSIDQSKNISISSCNWDDLISKPSNSFCIEHVMQNRQSCEGMFSGDSSAQPEEESKMEINETLGRNGESSIQNPCENMDDQKISGLYSGVGRRRLVFNNSTSGSSMQENFSSRVFPGIGLHINALAPTPEGYNNHSSVYRTSLINAGPYHPPNSSNQEMLGSILTKRKIDKVENVVARVEESCLESGYMENEEINPSSPTRKRPRSEQAGEGEGSCKRCNCKKSKCLKLYCDCFAAGVYCMGPCTCINCFNKPAHGDIVLATRNQIKSRNPFAFAPKVIRGSDSLSEIGDDLRTTPASARHKRGCNCKKSGCLKKYCECYQSGVGCSITCRCEGCKNAFGTKDGSGVLSMDHKLEEGETNTTKRVELNRSIQKTTIPDNLQQTVESALTVHLPASSFPARLAPGKSSFLAPPPKLSHLVEDKMPEFLLEGSSNGGNKLASSPNGKRVSPPKRTLV